MTLFLYSNVHGQWFDHLTLENLILNLISGLIGSIVIIFFIDRTIYKSKQKEKELREELGKEIMTEVIYKITVLLINMYKASIQEKIQDVPTKYVDFFKSKYEKQLVNLNLAKQYNKDNNKTWINYIADTLAGIKDDTRFALSTIASFMEPDLMRFLFWFSESTLINFLIKIRDYEPVSTASPLMLFETKEAQGALEKLNAQLIAITIFMDVYYGVKIENKYPLEKEWDWDNKIFISTRPTIGSGRNDTI